MLVLSRKVGEQIIIDDHIRVTVVAINGNNVRLGFSAPDNVAIHREEIYRQLNPDMEGPALVTAGTAATLRR